MQSEERAAAATLAREGERLHPLTLFFASFDVARRLVFPAIVGGLSAAGGDLERAIGWIAAILGVPALVGAVAKYMVFRYHLGDENLSIRSGVLNRQHRVIPLARVQNVAMRQSALQRVFSVAELRVETAGSSGQAEAVMAVLKAPIADTLRSTLLARRREVLAASGGAVVSSSANGDVVDQDGAGASAATVDEEREPIARLSTGDLMLAGATSNEAGVIAAAFFGALQFSGNLLERLMERLPTPEWMNDGLTLSEGLLAFVALALFVFVVGWIFSVIGTIVRYHDFTLERAGRELRKRHGLLTKIDTAIPLERVQAVRVEESLLRRPLDLQALRVATAGAAPGQRRSEGGPDHRAEMLAPIASGKEGARLAREVFSDLDLSSVSMNPVHPRSRRRAFIRYSAALLLLVAPAAHFHDERWLWVLALVPVLWGVAHWQWRNRGWALIPGYFLARNGVMNRVMWVVPDHKLQTLHVTATPFQRRHGLATLSADTAGVGAVARVVDLAADDARALADELGRRLLVATRDRAARTIAARGQTPRVVPA